jgi:O-acetylhomoserine/O-acetylserine sulfhydrylase-like pyridoxal-dependent enzyme
MEHTEYGFSTKQIHAGHHKNAAGSLAVPIYQSSTFVLIPLNNEEDVSKEKKKDTSIHV